MSVTSDKRESVFVAQATKVVSEYQVRVGYKKSRIDSQRFGYLMSQIMMKIYDHRVQTDSYICFRDWAWDRYLICNMVIDQELKNGKAVHTPYSYSHLRIMENLNFQKYFHLLDKIVFSLRRPLTRRTPLRSLSDF